MVEKNRKPEIRFTGFTDAWEQRKVGEYCEMFNGDRGINYPNDKDMVSDGIPFINAGDLKNGRVNVCTSNKITREKYSQLSGAKLKLGDIVYCLRGTLGKNAYIDNFDEGTVASSLVALRPKNIDSKYLFHILNSNIEFRQRTVCDEGAAQPNLSAKNLGGFDIPIPKIDEQMRISSYLDNLDNLITLDQRKYDKMVVVKKALLEKMFPKNGSNVPEIRFAGFTDAWEQRKLNEVSEIVGGGTPSTINPDYWDGDIDWYAPAEMKGQIYATGSVRKITEIGLQNCSAKILPAHRTILFTSRAGIGKMAVLQRPGATNQGFQSMILKDEYNPYFIYSMGSVIKEKAEGIASGSTFLEISGKMLGNIEIMVPNKMEQNAIAKYFESVDNLITLHQRTLEKLKNIKKSMLEKMFV